MKQKLAPLLLVAVLAAGTFSVRGQGNPPGQPPMNAQGPWNHDVLVYAVNTSGRVSQMATFERAGVPTLARLKDGRIIAAHQHFPANDEANFDKVAVRFSRDEGSTWTGAEVIQVDGLPEGMRFPFDPTLVALPDGRVRLYFTGMRRGRVPSKQEQPAIYSAVSADGVHYTFEPGVRFAVDGRPVIDCAAVLHKGVFHLYAPDNGTQLQGPGGPRGGRAETRPAPGTGYHATSRDGLAFTREADVQIEGMRRWLGNAQSDGEVITFFGTGEGGGLARGGQPRRGQGQGQEPRGGVWMGASRDGSAWKILEAPAIPGADPGAVAVPGKGWIVVSTGPFVPGRSAPEMRRAGFPPPSPGQSP